MPPLLAGPWVSWVPSPSPWLDDGGFAGLGRGFGAARSAHHTFRWAPGTLQMPLPAGPLLEASAGPSAPVLSSLGADSRGWGACPAGPIYLLPAHSSSGRDSRLVLCTCLRCQQGSRDQSPLPKLNERLRPLGRAFRHHRGKVLTWEAFRLNQDWGSPRPGGVLGSGGLRSPSGISRKSGPPDAPP